MISMSDDVDLHLRFGFPKGYDPKNVGATKYTTLIDRSPYTATGLELFADAYVPLTGFVGVGGDMRGTGKSEGTFTMWHADAQDSLETGNWIVQQPWSDGNIWSIGASADGLGSFTMNEHEPEWLRGQYIIWASALAYDVIMPNGAYLENLITRWLESTVTDASDCINDLKSNELHGSWWDFLNYTGKFDRMHAPSAQWAGWWDIFLGGQLPSFAGYQWESDPAIRGKSVLVVDPLGHCQDGAKYFPQNLVEGRTALSFLQSIEFYGQREVKRPFKAVTFYVMSSDDEAGLQAGNYWTTMDDFPQYTPVKYYLRGDGSLSRSKPTSGEATEQSYVFDPTADPIPTKGGSNLFLECGPADQREVEGRADQLTFSSGVFDDEMAMTGPLWAKLYVSSDAVDTDFMVKISDVYPDGQSRLLQDAALTMRNRMKTEYAMMQKGEVYEIDISLWNTSYVLAPGHALRVVVSSSNYPRFAVNRNNGQPLLYQNETEAIVATNTLHHSYRYPSHISLPFVFKAQLPETHIPLEVQKALPDVDISRVIKEGRDQKFWESILTPYRSRMVKN